MKKIFSFLLRFGIAAGLVLFLLTKIDIASIIGAVKAADPFLLLVSFIFFTITILLCFWRWYLLISALGIKVKKTRVLVSLLGGLFFNLIFPSTIGGDIAKSLDLFGHTRQGSRVVASVIIDRLSGFVGLALIAVISLIWGLQFFDKFTFISVAVLFSIIFAIAFFIFNRSITPKIFNFLARLIKGNFILRLKNLYEDMHFFTQKKILLVESAVISLFVQFACVLVFYILALAMGVKTKIVYFMVFVPIINAISALPISVAGLGTRDVSTVSFFAKVGMAKDIAFAISLMNFFFTVITGLIGGLIYVATLRYRRVQSHQPHLAGPKT